MIEYNINFMVGTINLIVIIYGLFCFIVGYILRGYLSNKSPA